MKQQTVLTILFLFAVVLITAFSACSPIYPLNPWDDANCFLLLGRSMLEGLMPYRDLFDHKGPLVWMVQAACDSVGVRPFFGFYLLEIVSLWAYLWLAYKTMMLFALPNRSNQSTLALLWTMLLGLALTTSDFFYYGNTVEEIGLPWIMYGLYIVLHYARNNELPHPILSIVWGVGIAIIFWSKFTVLSPFVGAIIAVLILSIRRHQMRAFWETAGWCALGFVGVSLFVVGLFYAIGGLHDMLDGYFGYNLFRYHAVGAEDGGGDMRIYPARLVAWAALVAIPLLHRRVQADVRLVVTFAFATTLILFAITMVYIYYFILCFAFFPLVYYYIRRLPLTKPVWIIAVVMAIGMVMTDFSLMQRCRGTFPKAILTLIDKTDHLDEGILTYRSRETGIYIYGQVMPPNRFWFLLSMVHQDLKDDQDACLRSRQCRYVIVKDQVLEPEVYDAIEANGYHLIDQEEELFRTLRLLKPKIFFWNLGWTQPIMRLLLDEEPQPEKAIFKLYERD